MDKIVANNIFLMLLATPGNTQWRNPQHITRLQAVSVVGAPTIDAHLSAAHDAVNMTSGNAVRNLEQEIVETLSLRFFADDDLGDSGKVRGRQKCRGNRQQGRGRALGEVFFAKLGHFEYTASAICVSHRKRRRPVRPLSDADFLHFLQLRRTSRQAPATSFAPICARSVQSRSPG